MRSEVVQNHINAFHIWVNPRFDQSQKLGEVGNGAARVWARQRLPGVWLQSAENVAA